MAGGFIALIGVRFAKGVQMGTRFVCSKEFLQSMNYKGAIVKAKDRSTVITGLTLGHRLGKP